MHQPNNGNKKKLSTKKLKLVWLLLKLLIFVLTLLYIYFELIADHDFKQFFSPNVYWNERSLLLIPVLILMLINWGLEAFKWRFLLMKVHPVSFTTAFKAVLTGVSVSIWLPNRVGEYLGRMLYLPVKDAIRVVLCTIVGNIAQLIVTLIAGSVGLLYFFYLEAYTTYMLFSMGVLLLVLNLAVLLIYFNMRIIKELLPLSGRFKKLRKTVHIIGMYRAQELWRVLVISATRYLVFTLQFVLLLWLFKTGIPISTSFFMVTLVFLIQSVVPSFALTEIGVRGATAQMFLSGFAVSAVSVLTAAYALWLINLIIPALIGAVVLLGKKSQLKTKES